MGMDVYGKKPKTEKGSYFRNNVWYWHPLWDYCTHVLPDIANKVEHAHTNDGDGLGFVDSRKLGFALRKSIESGAAQNYIKEYYSELESLPQEECFCTKKTLEEFYTFDGIIPFPIGGTKEANPECFLCNGSGLHENFANSYHITIENIHEFSEFLLDCGGFEIC